MLPKLKAKNFLIRPCTVSKCLVSKKKNKVHTLNVNYPSVAGGGIKLNMYMIMRLFFPPSQRT